MAVAEKRDKMIHLSAMPFEQLDIWPTGSVERIILQRMNEDRIIYSYQLLEELSFELQMRKQIMLSARAMNQSHVQFEPFEKSRCNPSYWELMNTGGFQLKPGVRPSDAIQDIYTNSSQYAFECATAIIMIYYHAALNRLDEPIFNQIFQNIYLYSWHFDPDLGLNTIYSEHLIPGDVVYFNNPDFHLETPWWRGGNAVVLEDGMYYSHGLGIRTAQQMIDELNASRNPGSTHSAYMENLVTRPSFKGLASFSMLPRGYMAYKNQLSVIHHNECSIPCGRYLYYLNILYNQWNRL